MELKREEDKSLYERLSRYADSDYYPCHMPGHKRNVMAGGMADFYRIDITEIDGFDDLHHPQGVIYEAQERANRLYGAKETYYLVGGSTCGVLACIMAVTGRGDGILIARNCHKSVYHAAIMQELVLHYYYPGVIREYDICDAADADEIGRLLDEYPDCKAVVVTSPTYEGIISDIKAIAKAVHDREKILIVDEAHGAHLGLKIEPQEKETTAQKGAMPYGAVAEGADLVIHSLHKTLPSLTQTALLHVNGERVDREKLQRYLTMLQSSSPSYVLMASMDSCIRYLEKYGRERMAFLQEQYREFMDRMNGCRHIRVGKMTDVSKKGYSLAAWDIGKIVISVKGTTVSGQQLYDILREEYHLQMEMAAQSYALAMMTIMDTAEGWQRLADAILQIDGRIEEADRHTETMACAPRAALGIAEAFHKESETVCLSEAEGRVCADFINFYPPGIPLLVPGEIIEKDAIDCIRQGVRAHLRVQGLTKDGKVRVTV